MPSRNAKLRAAAILVRMLLPPLLVAVLALPLLAAPPADLSFTADRKYPVGQRPNDIAVGDFNGDGKPDLATVNWYSDDVSVLINRGSGTYLAAVSYSVGTTPASISVGDFNRDGKLDIAVVNYGSSTVSILLGNGDGTFQTQKVTSISTGRLPYSLAVGDFNGDGKLDIATTVSFPQISQHAVAVLLGNGDGTFQGPVNYLAGSGARFVAVADFNTDGKLDIGVSNGGVISILLGNGDGTFQPAVNTPATIPDGPIAVADFNRDGKPDIVMVSTNTSSSFHVFLGRGNGFFDAPLMTPVSVSFQMLSVAAGDINGDGLPDVVVLGDSGLAAFLGKGDATFTQSAAFALGGSPAGVIADLNGDGKVDLAVPDTQSDRVSVVFGNGDGTFVVANLIPTPPGALFALTADINNDGKLDLVVTGGDRGAGTLGVLLGKGDGSFEAPINLQVPAAATASLRGPVVVADLNLDGKPDLVIANDPTIDILIGNGDGTFQTPARYWEPGLFSIGVGDFNGDGRPDVIAADSQGNLYLSEGMGDGTLGFAKTIPTGAADGRFLAVGDFNNDGKLDIALAGADLSILLGNGDGTFQQRISSAIAAFPSNIAVGDFNGDGNLDVVVTIQAVFGNPVASNTAAVLLGNGNGTLRPAVYYRVGVAPDFVAVGDLNNDGRPDLIIANRLSGDVSLLVGNGDGSFQSAEHFGANGAGLTAAVGDFNGDGWPDIAVGTGPRGVSILMNRATGPAPTAALAPSLVGFGIHPSGFTSGVRIVTVTNTGSAVLNIPGISLIGSQASDFSQTNTCGISLPAGGSCTLSIRFTPRAQGTRIASIVITDNAFSSPQIISLSGTGVAVAPGAGLDAATLRFAPQLIGAASTPQIITITNTGNAPLTISAIAIVGASSGDFRRSSTCPTNLAKLAAGASCTINVIFTPALTGNRTAGLSITHDASGSPNYISLAGTGTDFSLAPATGSNCPANGNCSVAAVITAGQTATYNLQASPLSGFNGNVTLTCNGAPPLSTCTISPASVQFSGSSSYPFTVTMNTTSSVMTLPLMYPPSALRWRTVRFVSPVFMIFGIVLILAGLLVAYGCRRRVLITALPVLLLALLYADGCGGGSTSTTAVRPPTSATITVTATSGGISRALNLSLTVNH